MLFVLRFATNSLPPRRPVNLVVLRKEKFMSQPLKPSVDLNNPSKKQRFLMGFPFLCPREKAYQEIVEQLKVRTEKDLEVWESHPTEVASLAKEVSEMLKSERVWPSSLFLPDDPAAAVFAINFDWFTDTWDLLPISFDIVEKRLGVEIDESFWLEEIYKISYFDAINHIIKKRAEQSSPSPSVAG